MGVLETLDSSAEESFNCRLLPNRLSKNKPNHNKRSFILLGDSRIKILPHFAASSQLSG